MPSPSGPSEDDLLAAVRQSIARDLSDSRVLPIEARHIKITAIVVAVIVVLLVVPMFFLPSYLRSHQAPSASASALTDLTQFSQYERGIAADQGAVSYVQSHAIQTPVAGGILWALPAGKTCYGVSVASGVISTPTVVASNYCSAG